MPGKAANLVDQLLENSASPLWLQEFGPEYDVPAGLLLPGVRDTSWHNDSCPTLTYILGPEDDKDDANNSKAIIWCDHPDAELREFPVPRFTIGIYRAFNTEFEVWSGDDPEEAVRMWRSVVDGQFFTDLVTD